MSLPGRVPQTSQYKALRYVHVLFSQTINLGRKLQITSNPNAVPEPV